MAVVKAPPPVARRTSARGEDPQRGRHPVRPRHIALGLAAGPGVADRLGDLLGRRDEPARRGLASSSAAGEALGLDEARAARARHGRRAAPPRRAARRSSPRARTCSPSRRPSWAARRGAAVLATLTIDDAPASTGAARAVARSSGRSASVSRTGASKLSFMWRSMFSQPAVGEAPAPRGAGVVDEQVQLPPCSRSTASRTARGRLGVGQVERDHGRAAELAGERLAGAPRRRATRTSRASGSRASRRAVASPIPLEAPVTRAMRLGQARASLPVAVALPAP